ncbi:MAG: hypothetical protein U0U67_11365 [Chitinophagales bacterium]
MKNLFFFGFLVLSIQLFAQRPATKAETDEDLRVLQTISEAMPREVDNWMIEDESKIEGTTGWYNSMDFSKTDIFDHTYKIVYKLEKADNALIEKARNAKTAEDFNFIDAASRCEIEFHINTNNTCNFAVTPFEKINTSYAKNVYRDKAKQEYTIAFIGDKWTFVPYAEDGQYCIKSNPNNTFGTVIQSIKVIIHANAAVADLFIKQMNWTKINGLIGSGKITDDISESELKKYFVEQPITPINSANTVSYTLVYEDGTTKKIVITSTKHDLANSARLRNHNPNPKILQESHIDFYLSDDKNENLFFHASLPIIRTTGTVTATYQSDYDYSIMWSSNIDNTITILPENMTITITKWAPVGGFIEGTFSGTGTLKDHNDFSTTRPSITILNGTFKVRRVNDEYK